MPVEITPMVEADIEGAIDCVQVAFADDPYNRWIFDDRSKVILLLSSPTRQPIKTVQLTPRNF